MDSKIFFAKMEEKKMGTSIIYMITAYNTYASTTRGVHVGAQKAKMGLVEPDSSLRNNSSLV